MSKTRFQCQIAAENIMRTVSLSCTFEDMLLRTLICITYTKLDKTNISRTLSVMSIWGLCKYIYIYVCLHFKDLILFFQFHSKLSQNVNLNKNLFFIILVIFCAVTFEKLIGLNEIRNVSNTCCPVSLFMLDLILIYNILRVF
jgi:hypothetical protein